MVLYTVWINIHSKASRDNAIISKICRRYLCGDIVSYKNFIGHMILHRVVSIGEDEKGKFFILKGDNADSLDPTKVRFEQIGGVVVGIMY